MPTPGKNLKITPKVALFRNWFRYHKKNSYKDFFQNSTHSFFVGKNSPWRIQSYFEENTFYMKMLNILIGMHAKNG